MRMASAAAKPCQGDSLEFYLITGNILQPLSVILKLKPEKLARLANISTSRDARVSPPITKESTVTPASKSLQLSTNADLTPSIVAYQHNEEMGISIALEDLLLVRKVMVWFPLPLLGRGAWYAGEHLLLQAWGKLTIDVLLSIQRILSYATRPRPNGFPLGNCSIAGQASIGSMG
ncbi:hypothetical protein Tco_1377135 [Tanacetum coccineum]